MIQNTPKGLRLQIGFFGRRNAGKSSLLNALAGQDVVIVSDVPGTTTDPVEKPMELPPVGPVLFIDTAGLDEDPTALGSRRADKSRRMFERTDLALLVSDGSWTQTEQDILDFFAGRKIPVVAVFTKSDLAKPDSALLARLDGANVPHVAVSVTAGTGLDSLRAAIVSAAPEGFLGGRPMLGDLIAPGDSVLLITPIDKEAPKGRMILPEVQAIRDTLDHDALCLCVTEGRIRDVLARQTTPPALAVTDSQAFAIADRSVPPEIPLTSFSILLARMKGDLAACAAGAAAIDRLHDGSRVLVAEACTHHPIGDDIGRVKLPRWIREYTKADVQFTVAAGADFPDDLKQFDLVLHCGACTFNRRAVLSRILQCSEQGVPFTNYGVAIAHIHGILERALSPFPDAYEAFRAASRGVRA